MVIEYAGPVISKFTMESRMALCNMSVEAGAKAGLIAPDATTFEYVREKLLAPKSERWTEAERYWKSLYSDVDACFDKIVVINANQVVPTVTWGTSPEQVVPVTGVIPHPEDFKDPVKRESCYQALNYIGLQPGMRIADIRIDKVFIGSCTNARLEDFRAAARVLRGQRISPDLMLALAVPGSGAVKRAAEKEGLDVIFKKAGFQWREAGCSLCVGLNEDALLPYERCASTSNRNFESRQGTFGRTHLVSPAVAAATAIEGTLSEPPQDVLPMSNEHIELQDSSESDEEQDHSDPENSDVEVVDPLLPSRPAQTVTKTTYTAPVKGKVAIIERANIDTDCIFPKQFCTTTERTGLGHALFHNLRYKPDGREDPGFVLNHPTCRGAAILLATGPNFGCGSSREHAVWALQDFGFRCIMAPSFADIFYNNAFKNGLLLVKINAETIDKVIAETEIDGDIQISLSEQTILDENGIKLARFDIQERRKTELLRGMDEINLTLGSLADIDKFEDSMGKARPWIEDSVHEWFLKQGKKVTVSRHIPRRGEHQPRLPDW